MLFILEKMALRPENSRNAIAQFQFTQNLRHMISHRSFAQIKILGNLCIIFAFSDEFQNFNFSFAQGIGCNVASRGFELGNRVSQRNPISRAHQKV